MYRRSEGERFLAGINLACIVGARPNFVKMAPLLRALKKEKHAQRATVTLIHTGQHYDANLSGVFFSELEMQRPDICLEVGSGSHGVQTARIIEGVEKALQDGPSTAGKFDRLVVVGDVNSTMAASIAAAKMGIPVAHIEAGLRSFDRTMPEEINRIVTDSIADMLFVSEPTGVEQLIREGHREEDVFLVGNVMIDTMLQMLPKAKQLNKPITLGLRENGFGIVTLHRPANVDDLDTLKNLVDVLIEVSRELPFVFPIHPRTKRRIAAAGLSERLAATEGLHLLPPLGYLEFLSLTSQANVIVSDSGGLQEESTALGIPCLTLRPNTERPITVDTGTSTLIGSDPAKLRYYLGEIRAGRYKSGQCPKLWDGLAAERIADLLLRAG